MKFVHHRDLFTDPTPGAILTHRLTRTMMETAANHTDLDGNEREQLSRLLILIARKLAAVWSHMERYRKIEDELIQTVQNAPPPAPPVVRDVFVSQDLFAEFDEFLVQVKSTLDHAAKLPIPIVGPKSWTLRTFGEKGDQVVKALRRNLGKKNQEIVETMVEMLFKPSKPWLNATIEARDQINHFLDGGIDPQQFAVEMIDPTGTRAIKVPMWSEEQSVREFLAVVWENLFAFVEDFTILLLRMRMHRGFTVGRGPVLDPHVSPWVVDLVPEMKRSLEAAVAASEAQQKAKGQIERSD
jgi:hypothetical protein